MRYSNLVDYINPIMQWNQCQNINIQYYTFNLLLVKGKKKKYTNIKQVNHPQLICNYDHINRIVPLENRALLMEENHMFSVAIIQ